MKKQKNTAKLRIKIINKKSNMKISIIQIKNIKYNNFIISIIPRSRVNIYLNRFHTKNIVNKIKIISVINNKIIIDKNINSTGWLYFPHHSYAVGVAFTGRIGVLATSKIPSLTAYFVPLSYPYFKTVPVQLVDFY